jgi:hypothetical protein
MSKVHSVNAAYSEYCEKLENRCLQLERVVRALGVWCIFSGLYIIYLASS